MDKGGSLQGRWGSQTKMGTMEFKGQCTRTRMDPWKYLGYVMFMMLMLLSVHVEAESKDGMNKIADK